MGLHATTIRLSPRIHEGEQRVSSLCDPPFEKSWLRPCAAHNRKGHMGVEEGGGRSPGRDGHSSVHSVDIVNVVNSTCPHGFSGKYPSKHCLSRLTYGEIYTFQLSDTW